MKENILYSIAGIVLGFFIGFFFANATWQSSTLTGTNIRNFDKGSGVARPLDETQMSGQLPPDHPSLDGAARGSAPAATSAQAQSAMDAADRNPRDYDAQMTAAANFYQLRDFNKAVVYLNRALAVKPNDTDALTGMGQAKYQMGDYASAATYFEKILAQNPDNTDVRAGLGDTYFQRKPPDYDRAIAEYRKALDIDPKHEHALAALADTLLRKGDKAAARDLINKLTAVNSSHGALPTLRSMLNEQ